MSIEETLEERGARYGDFTDHACIAQHLQDRMRRTSGWERLTADKRQALQVIADKIARILSGDPEYRDNWHDIQGYAKLAEDRCIPSEAEDAAKWDAAIKKHMAKSRDPLIQTLEQAQEEVRLGRVERLAMPGEWKVWRDEDGVVRSEVFGKKDDPLANLRAAMANVIDISRNVRPLTRIPHEVHLALISAFKLLNEGKDD